MVYLSNAFSLQMAVQCFCATRPVTVEVVQRACLDVQRNKAPGDDEGEHTGETRTRLTATSVVGHVDVACLMGRILGVEVPVNRVSVSLTDGDILYVGQYVGPRLPEGATTLPEGSKIEWFQVTVSSDDPDKRESLELSAQATMARNQRRIIQRAFGLDPEQIEQFLRSEDARFCGYLDEEGRTEMAKAFGLTRTQLDVII